MAIKASATITLSFMVDVKATYRYYKLQASTATAPSKPTEYPPSGWTTTEPSYTTGSTNTLYFVDCTVFTNNTFNYSAVSKSSSYEAAKEAFNKAVAAGNTANSANNKIDNLQIGGRNLLRHTGDLTKWNKESGISVTPDSDGWYKVTDSSHSNGSRWGIYQDFSGYEQNTDYTVSLYLKNGSVSGNLSIGYGSLGSTVIFGSSDRTWYSYTFNTGSNTAALRIYIHLIATAVGQNFYVKLPKLEKGNKPTDWTPAPEDVDSAINAKIASVDVEYYLSTSNTSLSGGSWVTTAPTWVNGKYMWSRTKITNGAGTVTYKPSETGTCIAGAKGDTGATGATGTGISSITEEYYLSTSKTSQTGGSWTTTPPTWSSGKYIWTRSKIVYTNPSSTVYTTPICDSSWEAVNEVQVGGRNYLLDSKKEVKMVKPTTSFNQYDWYSTNPLANKTTTEPHTYTLSFRFVPEADGYRPFDSIVVGYAGGDGWSFRLYDNYFNVKDCGNYFIYIATFVLGNSSWYLHSWVKFIIESYSSSNVGGTVSYVKLEEGNKPTDWTPAPEDVESSIEDAKNEAAKTATNYIYYDTSNGLQIGDKSSGEWAGTRAQIKADSYNILNQNGTELASFGANEVRLGNESENATISMRKGSLNISNFNRGSEYTQIGCQGNFDVSSTDVVGAENFRRGGILTTIEQNDSAEWQYFRGVTWNDLSSKKWNELTSDNFASLFGTYFETRIYADQNDQETANGFNTARISMRNAKNVDTNRIISTMVLNADAIQFSYKDDLDIGSESGNTGISIDDTSSGSSMSLTSGDASVQMTNDGSNLDITSGSSMSLITGSNVNISSGSNINISSDTINILGKVVLPHMMPVGYIFKWMPTDGGPELRTSNQVHDYFGFGTWVEVGATITVSSSTYDYTQSPGFTTVYLNDKLITTGVCRGHTLVVINPLTGSVERVSGYDTFGDPSAMDSAFDSIGDGRLICLATFDATSLTGTVVSKLSSFGSSNTFSWSQDRRAHAFIGIKGLSSGSAYEVIGRPNQTRITATYITNGNIAYFTNGALSFGDSSLSQYPAPSCYIWKRIA